MKTRFYFPVTGEYYDEEIDDYLPITDQDIVHNIERINEKLFREQHYGGYTMLDFFHESESLREKLNSIDWRICIIDDKPFGEVKFDTEKPLTDEETEILRDWITGQNSDGLGEGFEQRPIKVGEEEIYVSLWNSSDDYFIKTQDEMGLSDCFGVYCEDEDESEDEDNSIDEFSEEKLKPDCELIGQDGNIFNLIGIASQTLRENGMAEEATEMCTKIRASDSYYSALAIIGDYVNITEPDESENEDFDFGMGDMSL